MPIQRARGRAFAGGSGFFALLLAAVTPPTLAQTARGTVTLTLVDGELASKESQHVPDVDLDEFTRRTGVRVERVQGPEGTFNQLAIWRESLQRGAAGKADVYTIDAIWAPVLAEYLVDLTPQIGAAETAAYDPMVIAAYSVEGKVLAVPYRVLFGSLLYRTDLLRRYGYRGPPATWDELEEMAARIQAGERARGERDFWGYVWQGAASEALTCNALEWQAAEGGGTIVEADGKVSVNNPQVIRAWERAARWVGSISPRSVVAYREWDTTNLWGAGRAAFSRAWESDQVLLDWPGSPNNRSRGGLRVDKVGIARLPGGPRGRAGTLGGTGLAVSRTSAHRRETLELVRFLSQRRIERRGVRQTAGPDLPEVRDLPAFLAAPRRPGSAPGSIGLVIRPSAVTGTKYEAVTTAFIRGVHAVLKGESGAAQAAAAVEKELVAITGIGKGPPRGPSAP